MISQPLQMAVPEHEKLELWRPREDMEWFLRELRCCGTWQIESIKVVRQLSCVGLGEAKGSVLYSGTWADTREASAALHAIAFQALEEWQREDASILESISS